jgi:hypothetical protein
VVEGEREREREREREKERGGEEEAFDSRDLLGLDASTRANMCE